MKKHWKKICVYTSLVLVPGGGIVVLYLLFKDIYKKRLVKVEREKIDIKNVIHLAVNCDWCTSYILAGAGRFLTMHLEQNHDCSPEFAIRATNAIFTRYDEVRKEQRKKPYKEGV